MTRPTFAELLALPGVIEECELRGRLGFMAYHGGGLEETTDIVARAGCCPVRRLVLRRPASARLGPPHPVDPGHARSVACAAPVRRACRDRDHDPRVRTPVAVHVGTAGGPEPHAGLARRRPSSRRPAGVRDRRRTRRHPDRVAWGARSQPGQPASPGRGADRAAAASPRFEPAVVGLGAGSGPAHRSADHRPRCGGEHRSRSSEKPVRRPSWRTVAVVQVDRDLIAERIERELFERVLPLVEADRRPLDDHVGADAGRSATVRGGKPMGAAVGNHLVHVPRRDPAVLGGSARRGDPRSRLSSRRRRFPM